MVKRLKEAREYIARVEGGNSDDERHFRTGTLPLGEHWSAKISSLKEAIEAVDVPEPDASGGPSLGDFLRATSPKSMRDAVSAGVAKSAQNVELANSYIQDSAALHRYLSTVEASRKALNTLSNAFVDLGKRAVIDTFQDAIAELCIDTHALVLDMDDLIVAIRDKSRDFDVKADTFPQQVSNYLTNLETFSDAECAGITRALDDLNRQIKANSDDMESVTAFGKKWQDFVQKHNRGQTTAAEDSSMEARRQEILK